MKAIKFLMETIKNSTEDDEPLLISRPVVALAVAEYYELQKENEELKAELEKYKPSERTAKNDKWIETGEWEQ